MVRRSTGLFAFLIALLSLPAAAYTGGGNATVMLLGSPSANCIGWPNCPTVLNSAAAPLYTLDPTVNASIQSLLTALAAPLPLPAGASTSALQTTANGYLANISGRVTGNLALDSSIQSVLTTLQAPLTFNLPTNAATAANQATANGYLLTLSNFSTSASTSALQTTGNTSLASILAKLNASVAVTGTFWQVTQPVSLASAPLAPNAAQETGGNLAATAGSTATTATNTGTTASNTSTTATNTGAISTATGTTADAAYSGSGSSSIIAALKGIYAKLAGTLTISGSVTTTPATSATQTTNTITPVAITATSGTVVALNSSRKFLQIMNTGSNSCTLTTANPAISGSGIVLATGGSSPSQGGSVQYDSKVPTNAYYAICPTGLSTTFAVEEGN